MNLQNIPVHATIPNGWSTYTFDCPAGANGGDCFKNNNNGNAVTIVDVTHHMHGAGRVMRTFSFFFSFFALFFVSHLSTTPITTQVRDYTTRVIQYTKNLSPITTILIFRIMFERSLFSLNQIRMLRSNVFLNRKVNRGVWVQRMKCA